MVIFKKEKDIKHFLHQKRLENVKIGFVPTMGALHDGHLSLVQKSKVDGQICVCSIFVNPTQFNDKKDLAQYPVAIDEDIEKLIGAGCDILFLPSVDEVYPNGEANMPAYSFGYLETVLEGATRPGHFKGVGQVVARLLSIVEPHNLYLGQKDYQQCLVITNLTSMINVDGMTINICPTVREADGLAMSSRNRRLTESQRALAGIIYQCLVSIKTKQDSGKFAIVKKECEDLLTAKGFALEYVALAEADSLNILDEYAPGTKMVALIAAKIGGTRLIDNILL